MWRIDTCQFRWPWATPNPGLKVTVYLQVDYLRNSAFAGQSYYRTLIETIPNIWNGTMFGDLDWLLNASRGFVSISWVSCCLCGAELTTVTLLQRQYWTVACARAQCDAQQVVTYTCKAAEKRTETGRHLLELDDRFESKVEAFTLLSNTFNKSTAR